MGFIKTGIDLGHSGTKSQACQMLLRLAEVQPRNGGFAFTSIEEPYCQYMLNQTLLKLEEVLYSCRRFAT